MSVTPRRYLLVDDNRALAENLAEILRARGDDVDLVPDGPSALASVATRTYDALITDMRMPGMDGAELVRHLREVDPALPVVVITAYSNDVHLAEAGDEGVLAVLPKPVPIPRFVQLLRQARRGGFVLLLEADAALADTLSDALRERGLTPLAAATALEAQRLADGRVRPFAGVVDLVPPHGPSAVLGRLSERFPSLPLYLISDGPPRGHDVQAAAVLPRGVQAHEVAEAVARGFRAA